MTTHFMSTMLILFVFLMFELFYFKALHEKKYYFQLNSILSKNDKVKNSTIEKFKIQCDTIINVV